MIIDCDIFVMGYVDDFVDVFLRGCVYVWGCEGSGFRVGRWARPILTITYSM